MKVRVNGEERAVARGARLADLVEGDGQGLAIARNGAVVPRGSWATTLLGEGDEIEIVSATQGG